MFNPHRPTKMEVSTITCNEEMKGWRHYMCLGVYGYKLSLFFDAVIL